MLFVRGKNIIFVTVSHFVTTPGWIIIRSFGPGWRCWLGICCSFHTHQCQHFMCEPRMCRHDSVALEREGGGIYEWIIGNRHFHLLLHLCSHASLTCSVRRWSEQGNKITTLLHASIRFCRNSRPEMAPTLRLHLKSLCMWLMLTGGCLRLCSSVCTDGICLVSPQDVPDCMQQETSKLWCKLQAAFYFVFEGLIRVRIRILVTLLLSLVITEADMYQPNQQITSRDELILHHHRW